ncbi:conserved exported hypothetical protein [Mesorhizobium prunaredense]|uniref:M23ase beta-sheet core domain-containing protein n=1 Tax=Mesorhizobium prunaredense TaxID=1631249 RepID=A0A1R3VBM3_9HYPH|nr:M23 family metallopeptidase [Mesorhizobium prunaredense]SIT57278.1 conserved exported hypothetical protein [Mesorhizobium prunaredense]
MATGSRLPLKLLILLGAVAAANLLPKHPAEAQELTYFAPGDILPKTVGGIGSRAVTFPDWIFPMEVGSGTGLHAYIGTQLSTYHGLSWSNDPKLFNYPHRDNQCEPRAWKVQACPSGIGHQGVDIRANDNSDKKWNVIAVEGGVVTSITSNTTVSIKNGTHTVQYLHMHPNSIRDAGIDEGDVVVKGQVLGKVSCFMSGSCSTSRHLHFHAYTGTVGEGRLYHVYPSLIAAYRRAWGLPDGVQNGELTRDSIRETGVPGPRPQPVVVPQTSCAGIQLGDAPSGVDRNAFSSLWLHNCSVMGLVADNVTGARSFVYYRPKAAVKDVVAVEPMLFTGVNEAGNVRGQAKHYSSRCGVAVFDVFGKSFEENGNPVIELTGKRPQRDPTCATTGSVDEVLRFTYIERVSPSNAPVSHVVPNDRITLSEKTRNFLAITFYPDGEGVIRLLPYFAGFPGLAREGGLTDSKGGLIPSVQTDEAGAAISWVWIKKRARFTDGLRIKPRTVAHSMAGVDPAACDSQMRPTPGGIEAAGEVPARDACNRVANYLRGYVGFANGRDFASDYFGRRVNVDEELNLAELDVAWNWMRTMYSHESGRPAVLTRSAFERGLKFGDDYIASFYDGIPDAVKSVEFYQDPCNFAQPDCVTPIAGVRVEPATAEEDHLRDTAEPDQIEELFRLFSGVSARLKKLENAVGVPLSSDERPN